VKRSRGVPGVLSTFFAGMILTACPAGIVFAHAPAAENKTSCDIQRGPCIREAGDGMTVEFDIQPKPVTAMSGLTFFIHLTRNGKPVTDLSSVVLDLTMPGMYMGKNRPVLKRMDKGRYEGKGLITRCMSNSRTWQAEVVVERAKRISVAVFEFEVR
jgi:hypothetical protein